MPHCFSSGCLFSSLKPVYTHREFSSGMSSFGPRNRAATPSAQYGDVEAAARDTQCLSSGGSAAGGAQHHSGHGGNGVSGGIGAAEHGGNGSHHPGMPSGRLADWGRQHDDVNSLDADGSAGSGSGGSDDGRGLLDWQPDEPNGAQQQGVRRPWWQSASSGVALMCLLLTLGSFMIPESEQGIGMVMKHIRSTSANAKVGLCCSPPHRRHSYACLHTTAETSVVQHSKLALFCSGEYCDPLGVLPLAERRRAPRQGVCCPAAG